MTDKPKSSDQPTEKVDAGTKKLLQRRDETYKQWEHQQGETLDYFQNFEDRQAEIQRQSDANRSKGA